MTLHITAVVVGLPERMATLLPEALASVARQRRPADDIVIGVDPRRLGEVANMNRLLDCAEASVPPGTDLRGVAWAFLHDDDVWHPDHLAEAERTLEAGADVAVAGVKVIGDRPPMPRPANHADFDDLAKTNWFPPSAVVARARAFGRWTPATCPPAGAEPGAGAWVDWSNWRRLRAEGARFAATGATTCYYRFGAWGNGSW